MNTITNTPVNRIDVCNPLVQSCPEDTACEGTKGYDSFAFGPGVVKMIGFLVPAAGAMMVSKLWDGGPEGKITTLEQKSRQARLLERAAIRAFKPSSMSKPFDRFVETLSFAVDFVRIGDVQISAELRQVIVQSLLGLKQIVVEIREESYGAMNADSELKGIRITIETYGRFVLDLMAAGRDPLRADFLKTLDYLSTYDSYYSSNFAAAFKNRLFPRGKPVKSRDAMLERASSTLKDLTANEYVFHPEFVHEKAGILGILGEIFEFYGDLGTMKKAYEWLVRYENLNPQHDPTRERFFGHIRNASLTQKILLLGNMAKSSHPDDFQTVLGLALDGQLFRPNSPLADFASKLIYPERFKATPLAAMEQALSGFSDEGFWKNQGEAAVRMENWRARIDAINARIKEAKKARRGKL